MVVSVIIVNWNTRELLRSCLQSLRKQDTRPEHGPPPPELEVIVVDNASGDGSREMVAGEFPEVRLIANTANLNYAAASNQALKMSQGEYLLLLNPDTVLPGGTVSGLAGFLAGRQRAGAVAPSLVGMDGQAQASVRGFPSPPALFGEMSGLARLFPLSRWAGYRPRDISHDEPCLVDQPMTSCLMLRGAAVAEVGGFDEQFPLFFNDVDLCFRLKQAAWEIWYDPRIRVTHHGGASTGQVRAQAVWQSHVSLLRFYGKHYRGKVSRIAYAAVFGATIVTGAARTLWARISGPPSAPRGQAEGE